jgi:hypothetical protein
MNLDAQHVERVRADIIDNAQRMLAGQLPFIDGVRAIYDMLMNAELDSLEEPWVGFTVIDSETHAVPIGDVRERWHPVARMKFAAEWDRAELYAKSKGEPVCRAAIEWLDAHRFVVR